MRRPLWIKSQLKVIYDLVNYSMVFNKGDDFPVCVQRTGRHPATTLRAGERVYLVDLAHLSSVYIGIETVIMDHDLAFVRNGGGYSCYKLKVMHVL